MPSDGCMCPVFYIVSKNFLEMEVIILICTFVFKYAEMGLDSECFGSLLLKCISNLVFSLETETPCQLHFLLTEDC